MRVLLIRIGRLGDTVNATAVLDSLKQLDPQAQIDWVCNPRIFQIVANDPRVRRFDFIRHKSLTWWLNPGKLKLIFRSWFKPYDVVINLESNKKLFDLMRRLRAKKKLGSPFTSIKTKAKTHVVDNQHATIEQTWPDFPTGAPKLFTDDLKVIRQQFNLPKEFILLNATNSKMNRELNHRAWPTENWRKLIEQLTEQQQAIILNGTPNDQTFLETLIVDINPKPLIITQANPAQLKGILALAKQCISTDTGPAHCAAALNTPLVVMHGPTDPTQDGPYLTDKNRDKITISYQPPPCSPCYGTDRQKACSNNICMQAINVMNSKAC